MSIFDDDDATDILDAIGKGGVEKIDPTNMDRSGSAGGDDNAKGGDDGDKDNDGAEDAVAARLTALETLARDKAANGDASVAQLLAIPEVRDAYARHQRGEPAAEPAPKPVVDEPTDENVDWDELNNQQLAAQIVKRVSGQVGQIVSDRLQEVKDETKVFNAYVKRQETSKMKKQVDAAREAHSDFDQYKDEMLGLNRENPGLAVEELYMLACARAGKPMSPQPGLESERATSASGARPAVPEGRTKMPPLTREQKFNSSLSDAIDRSMEGLRK